jgi:hypothetical protein
MALAITVLFFLFGHKVMGAYRHVPIGPTVYAAFFLHTHRQMLSTLMTLMQMNQINL